LTYGQSYIIVNSQNETWRSLLLTEVHWTSNSC